MHKLPLLSLDLVTELDKAYPDRCPSLTDEDRKVWFKAGQRDVINTLLARSKTTEEEYLRE